MATNRRDVNLVVRARDEGSKAFEAAASALQDLLNVNDKAGDSAQRTGDRLAALASVAVTLDKAYGKIATAADGAAAAFARQEASIAEQQARLAAFKGQAESTARAIQNIQVAVVDRVLAGGDTSDLVGQLKAAGKESGRLQTEIDKLTGAIAAQEATLDSQRSALQQIGSVANAAADAQAKLKRQTDLETQALREQTAAAEANARAAALIRGAVGTPTGKSAEVSARVFEQHFAEEEAAIRARIEALKAEQHAQTELNIARERGVEIARQVMGELSGKSASASAAVFDQAFKQDLADTEGLLRENAAAEKAMAEAAARLRAEIDPVAHIQERLNRELAEANKLYRAGKISATELAQAELLLKNNADKAAQALGRQSAGGNKLSLFGLKPYELQNLGYQVNDVVTQLASGTSFTQTMAQQGGQLLQLFPKVGDTVIAAFKSPTVLGFTGAIAGVVVALKQAFDEVERLRGFTGDLASMADGARYSAEELNETARALDHYGLSAEDAIKITKTLAREGLDPSAVTRYGLAAKDMADILGIDATDAARQLTSGLTGGYNAIVRLNEATDSLNADQMREIRTLFDLNRAEEARALAADATFRKLKEGADQMRGDSTEAVRALHNAWEDLKRSFADTAFIKVLRETLTSFTQDLADFLNSINNVDTVRALDRGIRHYRDTYKNLFEDNADGTVRASAGARDPRAAAARAAELNDMIARRNKLLGDTKAQTQAITAAETQAQKIRDDNFRKELERREASEKKLALEDRIRIAREQALEDAHDRRVSDDVAATAAAAAEAKVRADYEKEVTEERKKQAAEAERQRREWAKGIGGNNNDRLMTTAGRFVGMTETRNRGDLQSFFRQNGIDVDPQMTAWCAAFVNAVLATNGIKGTGKLTAKSFLGFGEDAGNDPKVGDIVILNRGPNPAEGHVGFFQGFDEKGNVKVLGGNQRDGVNTQTFKSSDVVGIRRAPSQGDIAVQDAREDAAREERINRFNEALDRQLETRREETRQLREQQGLAGESLILKEREQHVEDALLKARQDAEKAGVDVDTDAFKARLDLLKQTETAYYDLATAKDVAEARRDVVERPVEDLAAQRDALMERIRFYEEMGNSGAAGELKTQLDTVNAALDAAITRAEAFWTAIAGNPEQMALYGLTAEQIDLIKLKLDATRPAVDNLHRQFLMTGDQINKTFAQGASTAFDRFAQSVAEGRDVMSSLEDAFRQFAADFLRQIANMIIQQMIFNAIGGATGGGGGGFGGWIGSVIKAPVKHDGGLMGSPGVSRTVDAAWFQNALRYHTGGIAGLKPNEIPAILERGEEVLTQADPRHVANGGGGAAATMVKIINALDAGDMLSQALDSAVGEKVILNFMRNNAGAVNQALATGG